jgi:hypothetical protein
MKKSALTNIYVLLEVDESGWPVQVELDAHSNFSALVMLHSHVYEEEAPVEKQKPHSYIWTNTTEACAHCCVSVLVSSVYRNAAEAAELNKATARARHNARRKMDCIFEGEGAKGN